MKREVIDRLRERCAESRLDALVCLSPENVAYAAGFVIPSQPLMRWRHAAVVLTADGDEAMVCVDMEETTVRSARPDVRLGVWAEFTGSAMATLARMLREVGAERGRIGIELDYLPAGDYAELVGCLPNAEFVAADEMLARARERKTPTELTLLSRLSKISDRAILDAFTSVKAGDTEMDIAAALTRSVYEQGAQQLALMIVATGERSQLPNVGPTTRTLVGGDVCRVEIFSIIDGYHAGVCRTAVVGDPSADAERVYKNLVECKHLVLDAMRPGAVAGDVYRIFRAKFDQLAMPPISFVGHGIGVNLHEDPYLGPNATDVLQPGMVFGMEPLVYRSGYGFGMQIKDMVAIGAQDAEVLSDVTTPTSSSESRLRIATWPGGSRLCRCSAAERLPRSHERMNNLTPLSMAAVSSIDAGTATAEVRSFLSATIAGRATSGSAVRGRRPRGRTARGLLPAAAHDPGHAAGVGPRLPQRCAGGRARLDEREQPEQDQRAQGADRDHDAADDRHPGSGRGGRVLPIGHLLAVLHRPGPVVAVVGRARRRSVVDGAVVQLAQPDPETQRRSPSAASGCVQYLGVSQWAMVRGMKQSPPGCPATTIEALYVVKMGHSGR